MKYVEIKGQRLLSVENILILKPREHTIVCAAEMPYFTPKKFDSGTGWPSFWDPIDVESVNTQEDLSLSVVRTEVCMQTM